MTQIGTPSPDANRSVLSAVCSITRCIYLLSGALAVLLMMASALLVVMQIAARPFGVQLRGISDLVAYATAGMTFLGLAYTFQYGDLIRVEVILQHVSKFWRGVIELFCLVGATMTTGFATYASIIGLETSIQLGESALFLPFPIWMAQLPMVIGLVILTLAFFEALAVHISKFYANKESSGGGNGISVQEELAKGTNGI